MSASKRTPLSKIRAPDSSSKSIRSTGEKFAFGSQLDDDSFARHPESNDFPSKPNFNQSAKSPRLNKQKQAVNIGSRIVMAANNDSSALYNASRELDALENISR